MWLWDDIKKHLADQTGKYIAIGVVAVVISIGWFSWDLAKASLLDFLKDALLDTSHITAKDTAALPRAISGFQQGVLGFVKNTLLVKDPNKLPDGKERNGDLARAISDFQKDVGGFVGGKVSEINGAVVGYVQAGTFELPYPTQPKLPSKKAGTRSHDNPYSFQIFAGNNSHVYLEFDISPSFLSEDYHIQLSFGEEHVCKKHKWIPGYNRVEFEVTDISSRVWEFFWDCQEPNSADTSKKGSKGRLRDEGHKGQLIPVRLAIVNELSVASLEEAAEHGPSSRAVSQISAETVPDANESKSVTNEPVTVGYIAVVSPLIEDVKSK